jgi:hypothetical protein
MFPVVIEGTRKDVLCLPYRLRRPLRDSGEQAPYVLLAELENRCLEDRGQVGTGDLPIVEIASVG